jgi:hypothetical protein
MKATTAIKPVSRAAARNCFLLNQLATPGLGSLMARRFVAGAGQLVLSVAGFILVLAWFGLTLIQAYNLAFNNASPASYAKVGLTGAAIFAAAWFWSLLTSLSVLRNAEDVAEGKQPPPVTKPPAEI